MKIGLNLLFLKPGIAGGGETYAVSLLESLSMISESAQYIVFINKETRASNLFKNRGWNTVTCPVYASLPAERYFWEQFMLPLQIKKHRLDLLHSLGNVQPFIVPCKSVVTIHDLNFYNLSDSMPPIRKAALRYYVIRSARTADHIITVSEFSKKQIVELLGVSPDKITVTYNAVKKRQTCISEVDFLKQKYGITQPYILALSSHSPHKNMSRLVIAFTILKQRIGERLKLVLVGHLPLKPGNLASAINESGFRDDVIFTGYVPDNDLPSIYSHAEAFIFPSIYEGFGIPILEAFMYGTSVICSRVASIPEVAGSAALYFDPYNTKDMAESIYMVLSDDSLRRELIRKGRARVQLFTWENTAKRTLNIYKMLSSK